MKKTLVPIALALGFAGAAHAQLSIYGLIDASYGKSIYADMLGQKADFHSGGDNGSSEGNSTTRFGLKGSTDVGSGIKMNFKLESNGIQSDGSIDAPFFQRQAWLGASGSFGEVRLGRQDSVPFQTMIDFDFNGASNGVSALGHSGVGPWARGRQSHSLQYISPTVGGLSGQAGFVPKGNRGPGAKDVISLGGKYAGGPFAAAVAYQSKDSSGAKDFTSFAGSYDMGVAKFMVGYADGGKVANGGTGKGPSVGVNFPVAGFNIGGHYAQNSDADVKVKAYEFWINKEVLKSTYAYFEAGSTKTTLAPSEGEKTKFNGYAVGVIYVF
jgi:predicted porin